MLVSDRDGRQLFSSVTTGHRQPAACATTATSWKRYSQTKTPQYSNLFVGAVKQRPIVTVEVPVFRDGEVIYDISFSPPIEIFQAIIEKQRPSAGLDDLDLRRAMASISPACPIRRRRRQARFAVALCRDVSQAGSDAADGVARRRIADHELCRSALTGWTVAAGIAENSLVGPLWRNLAITSVIGGLLLLTGLAFAVRMATTIARGEMLHDLLIEELNHRVKNTLAILQAIAAQTFRSASRAEREKFEGRLGALAEAHNLLSKEKWQGSDLQDVVERVLQPYLLNNPERMKNVRTEGAAVAAARGSAVDDRARDRHQRRQIRRAVERHRHRGAGLGSLSRNSRQAQIAAGLAPRPAGRR